MPEAGVSARVVLSTAASSEEAQRIGRTLVEERLAACATLVPGVQSIYPWRDGIGNCAIETSVETLLLLKTSAGQIAALEARLHELHSYETPEFLVLDVDGGSRSYLNWLEAWLRRV